MIVGMFKVKGNGAVNCVAPFTGDEVSIPVEIKMSSKPIDLRIGVGSFKLRGVAAQFSLFSEAPEDILGNYLIASAAGSIGIGGGIFTATNVEFPAINMNIGIQVAKGFGFEIGLRKMSIRAID